MTILNQLSSQVGDRTEASNRAVAKACLADPPLLADIAAGLDSEDQRLVGDCTEVMTLVAESEPALVVPYADRLAPLLDHSYTRTRWESMHVLALLTPHLPQIAARFLPLVAQIIQDDTSTIVRDHGVRMISNYAAIGPAQAEEGYPILMRALTAWGGKHAHHALPGLRHVADYHPTHREMIRAAAQVLLDHPRGVVRKEAQRLLRSLGK